MSAVVLRADANRLPIPDESVDLIVTSPPYFALRSYRDGGDHYDGQVGSEPTPQAFLEALWAVTTECWRVLKPTGSMFVNLGDKRSGSGGHNNAGLSTAGSTLEGTRQQARTGGRSSRRNAPDRYNQAAFGRAKSKMLLPHRYAIGCEDGLADPEGIGWIVRQDLVWSKPNGLPESVRDRTRDAHEYWFHLVKHPDYFSAVDELRTPSDPQPGLAGTFARPNGSHDRVPGQTATQHREARADVPAYNPLGALPRSVWEIPTEPLKVPGHLGVDHFAAFPSEWPRRLILGWSPTGICAACRQGRWPVVEQVKDVFYGEGQHRSGAQQVKDGASTVGWAHDEKWRTTTTITGYACSCTPFTDRPENRRGDTNEQSRNGTRSRNGMDGGAAGEAERLARPPVREYHLDRWDAPPTRPAVVLDPFGGTGTTAMVARALGRHGISVDLSADYCRLAWWRIFQSGHGAKVEGRTNRERQGVLA